MADQQHNDKSPPEPDTAKPVQTTGTIPTAKPPPDRATEASQTLDPATPTKLTAEEQMALYEKDLKENDWGHQPC